MPYAITTMVILTVSLISSLGFGLYNYKKAALLESEIRIQDATITAQNQAIHDMALEFEKYQCDLEAMNEYTRNKYNKVIIEHEDETCESKMAEFEKALNIFHGTDDKDNK